MKLTVNKDKRTLSRDEKSFFFLADTCWSAFTNISEKDWIFYLKKRKSQGFNTLQINILPQWDRSKGSLEKLPFDQKDGVFDFSNLHDSYFERAKHMCELATKEGFSLALVVLWANYVPGTWASDLDGEKNIFPKAYREQYFKKVIETFDEFSPLYFIGGDTDFPKEETVSTYVEAFEYFSKNSPSTLKTIHIKGRLEEIPEEIRNYLDVYLYQSGHNSSFINMPYYLAETFYHLEPKLPVINSEPCYEQMGFARKVYGRFGQRDVRKAAWQSILSGACAGVTYGAHGIWSWHDTSANFAEDIGEAFDVPMLWEEALQFPGANDYGFIKQLFELLNINDIIPANNLLLKGDEQIRVAKTTDESKYLIYIPSNTTIKLAMELKDCQVTLVDLKENRLLKAFYELKNNEIVFRTHSCQEDVLIILQNME